MYFYINNEFSGPVLGTYDCIMTRSSKDTKYALKFTFAPHPFTFPYISSGLIFYHSNQLEIRSINQKIVVVKSDLEISELFMKILRNNSRNVPYFFLKIFKIILKNSDNISRHSRKYFLKFSEIFRSISRNVLKQ